MVRAYVAVGSNLGDREKHIGGAAESAGGATGRRVRGDRDPADDAPERRQLAPWHA